MKTKVPQHYIKKTILIPVPARGTPNSRSPRLDQLQGILCHGDGGSKHPLPSLCAFKGMRKSAKGQPAATYQCPLCGARHHYVSDLHNGKPRLLWTDR